MSRTTAPPTARERLLLEAARLFRSRGFEGTSTRALSESLGLTKAALYHHVRSKDELLLELCVDSLSRIDADVTEALDGVEDSLSRLRAAIVAHVVSALENADMHATMLIEMRSLSAANAAIVLRARADYESRIRALVEAAQRDGHLRASLEAKWMTLSLLNTLNWSIFWYRPGGELTAEEIGRTLLDVYLNGVAGDGPAHLERPADPDATQLDRVEAKLDALLAPRSP